MAKWPFLNDPCRGSCIDTRSRVRTIGRSRGPWDDVGSEAVEPAQSWGTCADLYAIRVAPYAPWPRPGAAVGTGGRAGLRRAGWPGVGRVTSDASVRSDFRKDVHPVPPPCSGCGVQGGCGARGEVGGRWMTRSEVAGHPAALCASGTVGTESGGSRLGALAELGNGGKSLRSRGGHPALCASGADTSALGTRRGLAQALGTVSPEPRAC